MNDLIWLTKYISTFKESLLNDDVVASIVAMKQILLNASRNGNKLIFAGNGASASIASHCSVDFTKQAKIRAINFNEADLITCYANDYGYEHWVAKAIESYGDKGDIVVLISSSGKSPNIVNAAKRAKELGMEVITFTGFAKDNPLKNIGSLNFWLDSRAYNIIECTHMFWLMTVCDLIIGKAEYAVS